MTITFISGASKGIGLAIASELANLDHNLYLISNQTEITNPIFNKKNIFKMKLDLEDYNKVYHEVKLTYSGYHNNTQINLILCGSQLGKPNKETLNFELDEVNNVFKSNFLGNLALIKAVTEIAKKHTIIRIVFFGGGGAAYSYPNFFSYSLSKVATVRAVENLSELLNKSFDNASIITLAPGAVETDMLKQVVANGGYVKTKTDIMEPVNFVKSYILNEIPSLEISGMFLHVRDNLSNILEDKKIKEDLFKLRRIQ